MNKGGRLHKSKDAPLIRVLLIEDDPEDAQFLREMLAEAKGTRLNVKWADRLQAGLEHLADGEIDVLLLDLSLPDSEGLDTVLAVHSQASGVPIIVLTGLDDEALAMKAVRKGAQDYLVKGQVDGNLLVRSMRYAIERKRAGEALRESEERFRQLAENIREVFWMTDPRKKEMIYVSPAYEEIWQRTRKSLYEQPRSFLDSIHAEDRGAVISTFEKQAQGKPISVEYRITRPDGSVRWIRSRGFPVRNELGEIYRIVGLAEDITERKRSEEAIRESKELLEKTFKSQRDAIFLLDAEIPPKILDCNPAAIAIFGYSRQEMTGRTTTFLHIDEMALRKFQDQVYPAISERGFVHLLEFQMKRKDGQVFPTENSVIPLEDQKGNRIGWVSVVHDITERKRAEEALQKYATDLEEMVSERTAELAHTTAFLNNILDSSTEYAIVAADLEGTILNWNTGAKNIFGYDAQEVIGKVKVNIFYEKNVLRGKKGKNILRGLFDIKSNKVNSNSLKLVRKNGKSFPADITATYMKDAKGRKIGILAIIRDVTERKMLERQLIQSEKLAGIGTLAAGIAHEIRNPLSIINTSNYLLRDEIIGKTEEIENLLGDIEGGIKRTQTIINNLLDFSRPAACELESVDLRNLMQQILSLEGRALSTQNIKLKSDLNDVPKVLANLDSLKHIFLNLLMNAAQSMPKGGTLGIKTYQEDERVTVEISDTGIGIAEKDVSKIFDPFFTTKEPGKGTGLGLAFVHSEIERMGVTIRVASKPKFGSTFTVEFPLR
jgi:PAS domain S-box-containing protein